MSSVASPRIWTPSRTIKVGTVKDEQAMRAIMEAARAQISDKAMNILSQVCYAWVEQRVELVFVSNEQLGLTDEDDLIPLSKTHAAGIAQGLKLCKAEDGLQLAVEYWDQPKGESLQLAMKPIKDSNGSHMLFVVDHDNFGRWLHASGGSPKSKYRRSDRFVFRRK